MTPSKLGVSDHFRATGNCSDDCNPIIQLGRPHDIDIILKLWNCSIFWESQKISFSRQKMELNKKVDSKRVFKKPPEPISFIFSDNIDRSIAYICAKNELWQPSGSCDRAHWTLERPSVSGQFPHQFRVKENAGQKCPHPLKSCSNQGWKLQ